MKRPVCSSKKGFLPVVEVEDCGEAEPNGGGPQFGSRLEAEDREQVVTDGPRRHHLVGQHVAQLDQRRRLDLLHIADALQHLDGRSVLEAVELGRGHLVDRQHLARVHAGEVDLAQGPLDGLVEVLGEESPEVGLHVFPCVGVRVGQDLAVFLPLDVSEIGVGNADGALPRHQL